MANSFLDKNVVLAYCFTVESHHPYCKEYLDNDNVVFYITEEVLDIYPKKRDELTNRFSTAVLDHAAEIKRLGYDGELGPMDLQQITRRIDPGNSAEEFLQRWYEEEIPQLISTKRLTDRLHKLARDIEDIAENQKTQFDKQVEIWEREEDYPDVRESLQEIEERKTEDLWICIDAHDLAVRTDEPTELATADLDDFIRGGRDELILESTEIDEIVPLASSDP